MTASSQPQKRGFDWGKALGVLGDSLSIIGGGQAQYVPSLIDQRNRQQAQAYAEQQYQRRRGDENADWIARQEWEAANRPAPQPTEFERLVAASGLSPEKQTEAIQNYVRSRANPIDWIRADNGDGTYQLVPMGPNGPINAAPQAPAQNAAPQRPKGKLTPYNGGQTATPSGNFR
ncbi:hypothetical protein ACIPPQ_20140 [Sphingopyxis sp. LARHCG72]